MRADRAIVFLGLFGVCMGVAADPVQVERPAEILAETDARADVAVRDRHNKSGNVLRCWQHGRLLYEGGGFARLANASSAAVVVNRQGGGEALTVLNLQDGLCILSGR
jgi:hypothetical protein